MPHVADEGISAFRSIPSAMEEPVDKSICSDGSMFGDEVVNMRWIPIDAPSAPTTLDADFVHERIVAGPMFHQPQVPAPANTGKARFGRAY